MRGPQRVGLPVLRQPTAAGLAAPPPPTNRGVEITTRGPVVGIHTLSFTILAPVDYVREVAAWLIAPDHHELVAWQPLGHGGRGYRSILVGPGGAKIYASPVDDSVRCSLELPGSVVDSIAPEHLHEWCASLEDAGIGWWTSRVDVYADYCPFSPKQLLRAFQRGDIRTPAKLDNGGSWAWTESGNGSTFSIGSRSSERYLRCYDARGYTRLEMEVKGTRGRLVGREILLRPPREWPALVFAHLRQYVDFVDASADSNISRAPLLSWWAELVGKVEKARLYLAQPLRTLQRSMSWVERQVATTLAVIEKARPTAFGDWLVSLLANGRERIGPRHRLLLATASTAPVAAT